MPNTVDRHRGGVIHNAVTVKSQFWTDTDAGSSTGVQVNVLASEINKFRAAPLAIGDVAAQSSADPIYTAPAVLFAATLNDNGLLTARGIVDWWLEDTAGALIDRSAAGFAVTASGGAANVLVFSNSSGATTNPSVSLYGRVVSNSTGDIAIAFSSTGTSTARLFYGLPNGLVVAGSTLIFD